MSATNGKEYKLAIRIAGIVDKTFNASLNSVNASLKTKLGKLDASFTQLDAGFNKIMQVGQRTFRAIATAAGIAATAIGAASIAAIKVGADFEKQMSTVEAVSGATGSQMDILTEKARELGRTSVFSAVEVGQAMEYMGMAGWDAEQMIAGIDGVLNLAAASGEDLARVSDIVTDNLTAFHLTAEDTNQMVDAMAQAAMNANTNVDKMGESFKYAGAVMGSTFESSGTQFEDTAIAIALMANNGIKASIAGTALRNMITRMVKPTKESQAAIDRLGLSLQDDEGNMYSFLEVMRQLRTGFSEISDTVEKEAIAAMLGGQRGMNGLLAIAEATESDFNDLTDAIYNAQGAAEKMADIRLDNLAGDVTLFKDAVADLGIEFEQQNDGILRKIVQKATDIVGGLGQKIPEAVSKFTKKVETEIPKLNMKYKKYIKPIIDAVGNGLKWLLSHGELVISILAGIGGAMAAFKIGQSAVKFMNWIMGLGGAAGPIMGVVTAIGAVVGAVTALRQYEQDLVNDNLAAHFGDISLSMDEIKEVAEFILGNHSTLKQSIDEFAKLDTIGESLVDANNTLKKLNWKVAIGMDLSEEDKETYKQAIDTFVEEMQEYVTQQNYAIDLSIQSGMYDEDLESTNIIERLNNFYADKQGELVEIGQQLRDTVTEAFSDGLLDFDESKKIQELQQKMANVQQALATDELNAKFKTLELKSLGGDLDADSFQALMDELVSSAGQVQEMLDQAYFRNTDQVNKLYDSEMSKAKEMLSAHEISLREFQSIAADIESQHETDLAALTSKYSDDITSNTSRVMTFGLNTVKQQYAEELGPATDEMRRLFEDGLENLLGGIDPQDIINGVAQLPAWGAFKNDLFNTIAVNSGSSEIDPTTKQAITQLLEQLAPTVEDMQATADKCKEAGEAVPKAIMDGINEYAQLEIMANGGTVDQFYGYLGQIIADNPEYQAVLEAMQEQGVNIPTELSDAIAANKGAVGAGAQELYNETGTQLTTLFATGFDVPVPVRLNYSVSGDTSGVIAAAQEGAAAISAANNADGGIYTGGPFLSWINEVGPEAIIPLDNTKNAVDLWETTGKLLGQKESPLDGVDLSSGGSGGDTYNGGALNVTFSPVMNFSGGNVSREDVMAATELSFNKFSQYMDQYNKQRRRTGF